MRLARPGGQTVCFVYFRLPFCHLMTEVEPTSETLWFEKIFGRWIKCHRFVWLKIGSKVQWQALVSKITKLRVSQMAGSFLIIWTTFWFSRNTPLRESSCSVRMCAYLTPRKTFKEDVFIFQYSWYDQVHTESRFENVFFWISLECKHYLWQLLIHGRYLHVDNHVSYTQIIISICKM
jgi:hypothetical protein